MNPIWQAPLAPVALALTVGIILDRYVAIPLALSCSAALALLFAWATARRPLNPIATVVLWLAIVAAGAALHQWYRDAIPANDIRLLATSEGQPVRLRGVVHSEPTHLLGILDDPLRTFPAKPSTRMAVAAGHVERQGDWLPVSGVSQVILGSKRDDLHVGDEVELVGRLVAPPGPANPGEFDYAEFLRDQGIGAILSVPDAPDAVNVRREGWPRSLFGWLAVLRSRAMKVLDEYLPEQQRGVAAALLLGDGSRMTGQAWEDYLRTGVIHVLAISGQHLVVLAGFLGIVTKALFLRRRLAVLVIALLLFGYALLTGGRPPVMRAAWMVVAYAGGILLRRPTLAANILALAWIGVALCNPTDVFNTGCQLSFLAVAVLIWGVAQLEEREPDPLQQLIDESRPWLTTQSLRLLGWLAWIYAINAAVWLAVTPLVAARYHLVSPVSLLIGPPMVLLSSLALLFGLGMFVAAPVFSPLAAALAWLTNWCLIACEALVNWASAWPGAYFFVPDVPHWWLAGFYLGVLAFLAVPWVQQRWRPSLLLGLGWASLGCVLVLWRPAPGEFRCTFLAVGHGGCTVLETPRGQVIVYDAGAIAGPDVSRRHIAPFLWNRGIRRIDEMIISHGDLDHFNGLPALLERFAVGRVTLTPTFADRTTPGVGFTLRAMERHGLKSRVMQWPDQWETDGIIFEALHPPARGPEGNENARSLVLALRYQELTVLLTGDLEGAGLERVLALSPRLVDVLMAPHHGSRTSNTKELAAWARPKLVVSCQGPPKSIAREANPYEAIGARWVSTWSQGAVTIRRDGGSFIAETFQTKNRWPLE
jgi:competence protein ComEC